MHSKMMVIIAIALLLATTLSAPASAQRKIHLRNVPTETESVSIDTTLPVTVTYFYFWYDFPSKAHIKNPNNTDALEDHPSRLDGTFGNSNDYWYLREFNDMAAAGIDIVLPVYWGSGRYDKCEPWAKKGLEHITRVLDSMAANGQPRPAVGMFYDTTTLEYGPDNRFDASNKADLTTDYGKETFFLTIKSFFDGIPQRHWALYDGKPIIWLYSAAFAKAFDETLFPFVRTGFAEAYGMEPYIVAENSWKGAGDADAWYAWGAAQRGIDVGTNVTGIGPGYNDSAVPGRTPTVVDRLDGLFYERNWLKALEGNPGIVVIETWNELHEGSDICDTKEYGRKYIDLTSEYVDILKEPASEREKQVQFLNKLYYDTIVLNPAEVAKSDLENRYVVFPLEITSPGRNMFGQVKWYDNGTGITIDPPDDKFNLTKKDALRLDYTLENLDEAVLMGPLPYISGGYAIDGRSRPVPVRLPLSLVRRVDCVPAPGPMSIDGDLADWNGVEALVIAQPADAGGPAAPYPLENTGKGYPGWHPGDASMEIYSCWDSTTLYMAVVARDDIPTDGLAGRDMTKGDSIEAAFELDDDRNGVFDSHGDIDFAMAEVNGKDRFETFRRPSDMRGPLDTTIRYSIVRSGAVTVYEFSMPVTDLGVAKEDWKEGYAAGFDIGMNDNDGSGWEGFVQLAPGLYYGKDTRRFARLVLVGK